MVIPLHDINPLRRRPVVTWALIAANVLVFALFTPVATSILGRGQDSQAASVCEQRRFFEQWGAVPKELLTGRQLPAGDTGELTLGQDGTTVCERTSPPPFDKNPVLSVVTSMFLHGSWLHLLGNMMFLGVFGNNVEDRMGRLRYLVFYLACGFVAAYGFAAAQPESVDTLIGASGAVAGVLGAYVVIFPRAKVIGLVPILFFIPFWLPAWIVLGFWFVLQYLYFAGIGVSSGGSVAYGAHVAGFVFGLLVALPFVRRLRAAGPRPREHAPATRWVRDTTWINPSRHGRHR
ncbi:rhomboid family intramembrane serine protease [Frankia sp. CNm7]|uniref:Rhomboid family intramembrane serine protease n=1 Tax=Frankia nepalensis TaxID=1836974 RepID=A0A937R6T6_9ACTN|nr:rhomboid family intramembrane serine protease [Frankia nepalensis]MBL7501680.1 rhomboid family intramembrane serine protease [Frankia nepalensis]MBL7513404.1 rhomboid family intramembrane serine protease [Frankia nepalensis]MBL7523330.1 rhomboid family intramembrane serine protease [Frankia nepalensis]MBL7626346.1 rhomboid family intramembrane serine protease [Frankia nepalensis]